MPRRLLPPDAGPGRPMACRETSAQESGTPVAPSRIIREGATGPMERSGSRSGHPRSGGLAAARHHQSTATQAGTGQEQERNGVGTGVRQRRGTTGRRLRG